MADTPKRSAALLVLCCGLLCSTQALAASDLGGPVAQGDQGSRAQQRQASVCVAQWVRASAACGWDQALIVTAAGKTRPAAQRRAVARLRLALSSATQAAVLDATVLDATVLDATVLDATVLDGQAAGGDSTATDLAGCQHVDQDTVQLQCLASPSLATEGLCFAELADDPCWSASLQTYEGLGWRAAEEARVATCAAAVAPGEGVQSAARAHALRCQAHCLSSVKVHCIAD